jgi:hypothetical protein
MLNRSKMEVSHKFKEDTEQCRLLVRVIWLGRRKK